MSCMSWNSSKVHMYFNNSRKNGVKFSVICPVNTSANIKWIFGCLFSIKRMVKRILVPTFKSHLSRNVCTYCTGSIGSNCGPGIHFFLATFHPSH